MSTITINGREIELNARPKHAAVVKVQNLMTDWLMSQIDTSNMDQSVSIEVALQKAVIQDRDLTQKVTEMQQTLEIDQTIILSTGMEYSELVELKNSIYEDEYVGLFEAACKAIGGTANDFFGLYYSGIRSMRKNGEQVYEKK